MSEAKVPENSAQRSVSEAQLSSEQDRQEYRGFMNVGDVMALIEYHKPVESKPTVFKRNEIRDKVEEQEKRSKDSDTK